MQWIRVQNRVEILDVLRGWALLGVVLMNYYTFYYKGVSLEDWKKLPWGVPFNEWFGYITATFFGGKSWKLLCFLFGYGFGLLLSKPEQSEAHPFAYFSKRMFWLLTFSIVNTAFYSGDILKDYALMGLILFCFRNAQPKTLLLLAISIVLLLPLVQLVVSSLPGNQKQVLALAPLYRSNSIFDIFQYGIKANFWAEIVSYNYLITVHLGMLACFLLGLAAQKIQFLERLVENRKKLRKIFWLSLGIGFPTWLVLTLGRVYKWQWLNYYSPSHYYHICFIFFVISGLSLVYLSGKMKGFFDSLKAIGRLTLTNYLMQSVLSVMLFSGVGFDLINELHPASYLLIALVVFAAQLIFSKWWLQNHRYGPAEFLWRKLSGRVSPETAR